MREAFFFGVCIGIAVGMAIALLIIGQPVHARGRVSSRPLIATAYALPCPVELDTISGRDFAVYRCEVSE